MTQRKIMFRGLAYNGKWVYGTPVYYKNGDVTIFNDSCDSYGCEATSIMNMRVQVLPETVGQYTGLQDKNGKDIYEGDIIKSAKGVIGAIEFSQGAFIWMEQPLGNFESDNEDFETESWSEIIGNIHQNPELLPNL